MRHMIRLVAVCGFAITTCTGVIGQEPMIPKPTKKSDTVVKPKTDSTSELSKVLSSSTVQDVLSAQAVDSVVKAAIAKQSDRLAASFVLTSASFKTLKQGGQDARITEQLRALENQRFKDEDEFKAAIDARLGREFFPAWYDQKILLDTARTSLIVTPDFVRQVEYLILKTRVPRLGDPKEWLEKGFSAFLVNYIAYKEARSDNRNVIVFHVKDLDAYLRKAAATCGERPCSGTPPCCADCDPCN